MEKPFFKTRTRSSPRQTISHDLKLHASSLDRRNFLYCGLFSLAGQTRSYISKACITCLSLFIPLMSHQRKSVINTVRSGNVEKSYPSFFKQMYSKRKSCQPTAHAFFLLNIEKERQLSDFDCSLQIIKCAICPFFLYGEATDGFLCCRHSNASSGLS